MEHIIKAAVECGASDLHIKAGDVFRARIDGVFKPLTKQRLTPEQTKAIALQLIPNEADRDRIDSIGDYDCSWGAPGIGRFRVNLLRQRSSFMVVMRAMPFNVPTIEVLALPRVIEEIAKAERGLVLVSGPAGNGKSCTIAAMIQQINSTLSKHVITLEDPIEFLHRDIQSSVTQREVGVDTESLKIGVRAALRQDADVIFVSELVDNDVASTIMQAVETGSLVISTFHAPDATSAVGRMVSMFPLEEQEVARIRLADALHAVVSQRLLPRADGKGRIAAVEVLISTPEIREVIRNRSRAGELHSMIEAGKEEHQMQTFDQHLHELVGQQLITTETAVAAASDASIFDLRVARAQTQLRQAQTQPRQEEKLIAVMMRRDRFHGVLVPLTTPFDPTTGDVAPVALRNNARAVLDAGASGVVVAGSTGEASLLSDDESRQIVGWLREVVPEEKLLIVGAGRESTRATIAACRDGAENGADAALVRPPAYFARFVTQRALADHFRAVAEESPIPILVYNIPVYTNLAISESTLMSLAGHTNIVGVKDSSGDLKNFAAYRDAVPQWACFIGSGALLYAALEIGAVGGILAVANFAADTAVEVAESFARGEKVAAGNAQERLTPLHKEIVGKLGPPGVKLAMDAVGLVGGRVRSPLVSGSEADETRLKKLLQTAQLISA